MLYFTQHKTTWFNTISSHCLAALLAKMSKFNSHKRQNAYCSNLKRTFEDLWRCYCYAIKYNSRTIRSQVSRPPFAGKGANMSKVQAAWHQDSEAGSCAVVQCECHTGK